MDIQEAIEHARQVAEGCDAQSRDCAYQHDKLADWLEELVAYRATKLTPDDLTATFDEKTFLRLAARVLDTTPERLQEFAHADQAGRLVVLPADKAWWLKAILGERERQDKKWGFPQENTYGEWGSILAEEAGELCKELNELNFGRGAPKNMETEAVQVTAVALSILEHFGVAHNVTAQVAVALGRLARQEAEAARERGEEVNDDA